MLAVPSHFLTFTGLRDSKQPEPTRGTVLFVLTSPSVVHGKRVPASQEHPFYWVENNATHKCVVISENEMVDAVANDVLHLKVEARGT